MLPLESGATVDLDPLSTASLHSALLHNMNVHHTSVDEANELASTLLWAGVDAAANLDPHAVLAQNDVPVEERCEVRLELARGIAERDTALVFKVEYDAVHEVGE
jgi:hypothetical protein